MKCPKCQIDNPDKAKFCIECGASMEFLCPQCGTINPVEGKFCMECGHNISFSSEKPTVDFFFDEKVAKIQTK